MTKLSIAMMTVLASFQLNARNNIFPKEKVGHAVIKQEIDAADPVACEPATVPAKF